MVEIRRHFHQEMDDICADAVRLGGLAVAAIERGTDAFLDLDVERSNEVVAADSVMDDLMHSIESRTFVLLATQAPMARDLRLLVTVLRVSHELERIGDLMVNVAQATHRVVTQPPSPVQRGIIDAMRVQAVKQLRVAVTAIADRDPSKGGVLSEMDDVMDDLQKELFRALFNEPVATGEEATVQRAVQMALVGRYYERIADHAVNVGERVDFMEHGA
jgi:phosphate transport system protein